MSFHLEGHMELPEDRRDAVLEALPEHVRLTRAEPGCESFEVSPGADRLDVRESFRDEAAFRLHQARISGTDWEAVTRGLGRDYRTWADP